jgi:hypothetical protein
LIYSDKMKLILKQTETMRYKLLTLILTLALPVCLLDGQAFTEKKTFRETMSADRETTLEVDNKYGTIHITTWNKDSVEIRAEIEAFSSDLDRLRKMFQGINVNISGTRYLVRAYTSFTQSISMLFESFKGLTSKIIPYESRIQVNYFINAPEYIDMRITNKYGDVYMENNTGNLTLNLSNGAFKANILNEANGFDLVFCDATVNKLIKGRLNTSFSEVEIDESRDLTITSVSSKFYLKNTVTINTESRRDEFFVGSISSLRGNAYFSDFRIEEVQKEINMVTKYGDLDAKFIGKGIEMVTLNSGYTDISLAFDKSVSYNLDIRYLNSFMVLPEENAKLEKKVLNEEKKEYMTYGTVGRNPGNVKVIINATRGNIYLK